MSGDHIEYRRGQRRVIENRRWKGFNDVNVQGMEDLARLHAYERPERRRRGVAGDAET